MHRTLLVVAVLALGGGQAVPPHQPGVTFKVGVDYVEVDAVVTDSRGQFVRDLTRDDFEVREDGKPQSVTGFTLVDVPVYRAAPAPAHTPVILPDAASNSGEFSGRVFLLVLDDLWTDPSLTRMVRAAATEFVHRTVGADDVAAVVTTSGVHRSSQDFTASHARLTEAINIFVGVKREDAQDHERALMARSSYAALAGLAEYLGGIRGRRKAIVWFGEGIDYDVAEGCTAPSAADVRAAMEEAIGACNRANVSVYGVDPRGVGAGLDLLVSHRGVPPAQINGGPSRAITRAQNSLRTVSNQTGGFAIVNRTDVGGAFAQIVEANSQYYVLGYSSSDTRRDGRFRKLEVRVRRPGLRVVARRGYAVPKGSPAATTPPIPAQVTPALRDALASPIPASALGLRVTAPSFAASESTASLAVVVEVEPGRLAFTEQGGMFGNEIELVMVAVDANNKSADGKREQAPMRLSAGTHEAVREHGFRLMRRLEVPPGRYQLRVAARQAVDGAVGSLVLDVDVPDFSKPPLQMSSLALASEAASRIPTANPDPALTAVLPGSPTAQREFAAADTLTLFAEVYDHRGATPRQVAITTTVIDGDGRVVFTNQDERASADAGEAFVGRYLVTIPLEDWRPGRYVARVDARSPGSDTTAAFRELEFRIR